MLQPQSLMHQPPLLDGASSTISGLKYRWLTNNVTPDAVRAVAYKHGLSLPIAHVLVSRGITDDEQVRSYLFSSYEQDVPHPRSFKGIEQAGKSEHQTDRPKEGPGHCRQLAGCCGRQSRPRRVGMETQLRPGCNDTGYAESNWRKT